MLITKRIERLYSLKEYENVKVIVEIQEEVNDPVEWLERLSKILWDDIKQEKEKIKQSAWLCAFPTMTVIVGLFLQY